MSCQNVRIRELGGWDLDAYEYRPPSFDQCRHSHARQLISARPPFEHASAFMEAETVLLRDSFAVQSARSDLQAEMSGLDWSLGIVDARLLLAFQRRLAINPAIPQVPAPAADDWSALTALSFGPAKPVIYDLVRDGASVALQSSNPNLHFRVSTDPSNPIAVHAGSPFFEVAEYRGRWFLRDGYHRAYALLRSGVWKLPAVIVQARTLEELGAIQPWFFPEGVLFSHHPPRVTDFLDDALIFEYDRPSLIKTLRVTMEETFAPAIGSGENS